MSAFPLLSTKLSLPPRRPSLVSRLRLQQKLDLSLRPGNRLTVLSAPPGFGKTTLALDWLASLAQRSIPFAWLSLDEGDNDLARFLRYFVAALQKIQPELGETALAALDLPQTPSTESLMIPLINDIQAVPDDFVLVLDDYQLIRELAVHQAVGYLIDHQPQQMHLVITTRVDPLLPVARLRARGEVNEIRSAELRFTREETLDFIQQAARLTLSPEQAAVLERNTEGWVTGLQIAAIAMDTLFAGPADPPGLDNFVTSFGGTHKYIFDYLAQEVLSQLDPGMIDFLHQTAVLNRLTPDLCDHLTGRSDSEQLLRQLDRTNLFLIPLTEECCWYRYHHLFADFLRSRLGAARRSDLYRRAADWCEQNDLVEEAVSYALAAQDWPGAARLICQAAASLFRSGELVTLLKWLDGLPKPVLQADIDLCTYAAWVSLLHSRLGVAGALTQQAEALLDEATPPASRGRVLSLRAYLAFSQDQRPAEAVRLAEEAVGLMGPDDLFFRMLTLNLMGQVQHRSGNVGKAIRHFDEAIRMGERQLAGESGRRMDTGLVAVQGNLAYAYAQHGERRRAAEYCQELSDRCTDPKGGLHPAALFFMIPWAYVCFDENDLEKTRQYTEKAIELCAKMGIQQIWLACAYFLSIIQFTGGDAQAAFATIRADHEEALRLQYPLGAKMDEAAEAGFHLASGNLAAAQAWAESAQLPPPTTADPERVLDQTLQAKLLIAQKQYGDAETLLGLMCAQAEASERFHSLIELEILRALAWQSLGRREESRQQLLQAARRAAPEEILRPFLDNDTFELARELRDQAQDPTSVLASFLDQILALSRPAAKPAARPAAGRPAIGSLGGELVESLTARELEVIQLMAEGLTNADIARKLYLSPNTLKAHTQNIFSKLDAHSRIQAVNRARELGMLPKV